MMNDMIKAGRATRPRRKNVFREALGKYASAAENCIAMEPPRHDDELDNPPRQREI
jgi:hypothetical protein